MREAAVREEDGEEAVRRDGRTRLYVEAPLAAGVRLELDGDHAHYLRHVLRLAPGSAVAVFNGGDGEWRAVIEGFSR